MELHKHPIWVTVGILSGMTFLFNAGFIYSTINRDWMELKKYKQNIGHNSNSVRQLSEENRVLKKKLELIIQVQKKQAEQNIILNDKINQCMAKKAVYSSYNF